MVKDNLGELGDFCKTFQPGDCFAFQVTSLAQFPVRALGPPASWLTVATRLLLKGSRDTSQLSCSGGAGRGLGKSRPGSRLSPWASDVRGRGSFHTASRALEVAV
ncbi:unnamed protein product [Rangifer tarandus platyrhynchus]|uniref:Uncharacterized protein n=2 Tax=Rangifer tarandus platyrhynchus TaxID=3082113 RepID=A0AC59YAF1_RANTA|nr:unnamed protein product [Rangifer tarandus platyrhynchus]